MKKYIAAFYHALLLIFICISLFSANKTCAQDNKPYVRIAKIVVDSSQLNNYKAAVSKEPGVLTLYAVYDKEQSASITVFEIYASVDAYKLHIQTAHFLKYKTTVKDMVKSLVLTDVVPNALETKPKL